MVLRQGVLLGGIGVMIALVAALGTHAPHSSPLYWVEATDPVTFEAVAALLIAVAVSCLAALRASRTDPLVALRFEGALARLARSARAAVTPAAAPGARVGRTSRCGDRPTTHWPDLTAGTNGWVRHISVLKGTTSYGTLPPFARRPGQSHPDPRAGSGQVGPRACEPRHRNAQGHPSGPF